MLERFYACHPPDRALLCRFAPLAYRQAAHPVGQAAGTGAGKAIRLARPRPEDKDHGEAAIIIGAGFGGLALAIRLQSAGVPPPWSRRATSPAGAPIIGSGEGFTFDAGPTVITDPACLRELWALSGSDMAEDVELMPVMPFYRLNWPDGTNFDYSNDEAALNARDRQARTPRTSRAMHDFLDYSKGVYEEGYVKLGSAPFLDFRLDDQGGTGADEIPGVAVGLFDGVELCEGRAAARGASRSTPCSSAAIR
jgi:hypothetical protein